MVLEIKDEFLLVDGKEPREEDVREIETRTRDRDFIRVAIELTEVGAPAAILAHAEVLVKYGVGPQVERELFLKNAAFLLEKLSEVPKELYEKVAQPVVDAIVLVYWHRFVKKGGG